MAFSTKFIYFDKDYRFELIGSTIKKFVVFSVQKPNYQNGSKTLDKNSFETFLLIKALPDWPIQKNLVFTREKIQSTSGQKQKLPPQTNYLESESYFCSFLRHVDLLYCKKLNQTLQILGIYSQIPIENQWLLLYEVSSYKPNLANLVKFQLKSPVYGGKTLINNSFGIQSKSIPATISNLFKFGEQNFYFVNDCLDPELIMDLNIVTSFEKPQIFGFTLKIKDEIALIPLSMILFGRPSETIIEKSLLNKLMKTCYVEFLGSYCTGIIVEETKIITARHLFPKHQEKVKTKVNVRIFPYQQNLIGEVSKIGTQNLDIMEIQLIGKENDFKFKNNNKIKFKNLVKQDLIGSLIESNQEIQCQNQIFAFPRNFIKKIYPKQELTLQKKYFLGDEITALGFGKLPFHTHIFNKFDIILPTIAIGVISKVVKIGSKDIFMKTDAKLYSGFSGCGIWKDDMVGMAVFILKNKTNSSHLNRQNFSYTNNFIKQLRRTPKSEMRIDFNSKIQQFDQIQTRHQLNYVHLPKPKL